MGSPFNIISNGTAPLVPAPNAHPRPDWLKVKFFGGNRYQDLKRIMRLRKRGSNRTCDELFTLIYGNYDRDKRRRFRVRRSEGSGRAHDLVNRWSAGEKALMYMRTPCI